MKLTHQYFRRFENSLDFYVFAKSCAVITNQSAACQTLTVTLRQPGMSVTHIVERVTNQCNIVRQDEAGSRLPPGLGHGSPLHG